MVSRNEFVFRFFASFVESPSTSDSEERQLAADKTAAATGHNVGNGSRWVGDDLSPPLFFFSCEKRGRWDTEAEKETSTRQ